MHFFSLPCSPCILSGPGYALLQSVLLLNDGQMNKWWWNECMIIYLSPSLTSISPSLTSISPSLTSILPSLAWSTPSFPHLTIIEKLHRLLYLLVRSWYYSWISFEFLVRSTLYFLLIGFDFALLFLTLPLAPKTSSYTIIVLQTSWMIINKVL